MANAQGASRKDRKSRLVHNQLNRDAAPVIPQALPRTIIVEEFAAARLAEIASLKRALSSTISNNRASQDVPRHLRRRASSHNIYRLPARLRQRARDEMDAVQLKPRGKPKRRERRRPSNFMSESERRSSKHCRLETHLWHAKRMHMENMWGYRLSLEPTDKGQRATFKASQHFCTVFDASATSCLEITGDLDMIIQAFRSILPPDNIAFKLSSTDYRCRQTMIHETDRYPYGAIAACNIMCNPNPSSPALWFWIHPAVHDVVSALLHRCLSSTPSVSIVSTELLKFELSGNRCQSVLSNVLRHDESCPENQSRVWNALSSVRTQSSLPSGAVLGLQVKNPKTFSTAQHLPPVCELTDNNNRIAPATEILVDNLLRNWSHDLSQSLLWSPDYRDRVSSSILDPNCTSVPVLLVQRLYRESQNSNSNSGWDLILPKGWGMAFWKSLIYAGARAIGFNDRRNIMFEQAYIAAGFASKHERTPKAKRVNFEVNKIVSPFQPDWGLLLPVESPFSTPMNELCAVSQSADKSSVFFVLRDRPQISHIVDKGQSLTCDISSHCLIRVRLHMCFKGVPYDNALVFVPSKDMCDQLRIHKNKWSCPSDVGETCSLVAIVHKGGFSLASGIGVGFGFASLATLNTLPEWDPRHKRWLVLIRNVNSQQFQFGWMSIANQT